MRRELGKPPELPLPAVSDSALKYVRGVLGRDRHRSTPLLKRHEGDLFADGAHATLSRVTPASEAGRWQVTKSTWERIKLSRDVELSIRRPLTREQNKRIDRLLEAARQILSEED